MLICLMAHVSLACACWWGILVGRAKSAGRSCSTGPELETGPSVGLCNHGVPLWRPTQLRRKRQMRPKAAYGVWTHGDGDIALCTCEIETGRAALLFESPAWG